MDVIPLIDLAPVRPPTAAGEQPAEAQAPLIPFSLGCGEKLEHAKALWHRPGEDEPDGGIESALFFGPPVQAALPPAMAEPGAVRTPNYPIVINNSIEHGASAADPPQPQAVTTSTQAPASLPAVRFTALVGIAETGVASSCELTATPDRSAETRSAEPFLAASSPAETVLRPVMRERGSPLGPASAIARNETDGPPEPRDNASPVRQGDFGRTKSDATTAQQQPVPTSSGGTPSVDGSPQRVVVQRSPTEPPERDGTTPPIPPGSTTAAPPLQAAIAGPNGNYAPGAPGGLPAALSGRTVDEPAPLVEAAPGFGPDSATPESSVVRPKRGFALHDQVVPGEGKGLVATTAAPVERAEAFTPSPSADAVPVHVSPSLGDTTLRADIPAPARAEAPAPPPVARQLAEAFAAFPDRPVEITLSPEELGRVRMVVTSTDGTLVLSLAAERPETLDLMRRHIDQLAADLRDLGFSSFRFSFAGEGTGREDAQPAPLAATSLHEPVQAEPTPSARTVRPASAGAGLDIRL